MQSEEQRKATTFVTYLQLPIGVFRMQPGNSLMAKAWKSDAKTFRTYSQLNAFKILDPHVSEEHVSDYKINSNFNEPTLFGHLKWTRYMPSQIVYDRLTTLPKKYAIRCAIEHLGPAIDKTRPKIPEKNVIYKIWDLWVALQNPKQKPNIQFADDEKRLIMDCLRKHKNLSVALDLPDLNAPQLDILSLLDRPDDDFWSFQKQLLDATGIEYMDIDQLQDVLEKEVQLKKVPDIYDLDNE